MNYKNIYSDLQSKSFKKIQFSKEFLLVEKKEFEKYRKYFKKPKYKNLFNSGINLRTKEKLNHIHLVEYKIFVQLHIDFGNLDRCYLFGFLHLFSDVLLYHFKFIFEGEDLLKKEVKKYLIEGENY